MAATNKTATETRGMRRGLRRGVAAAGACGFDAETGPGTMNDVLHVGQATLLPITSVVADMRWPQDGHSNRNGAGFIEET